MGYIEIVLAFATYIILESVIVQLIHMLSDCKIKNKVYTFAVICVFSAINRLVFLVGEIPIAVAIMGLVYLIFSRLLLYITVFRKIDLKLVYVFLIAPSTNQIYYNVLKTIFSDDIVISIASYLTESIVLLFVLVYIKKKNKEELYKQIIESLPRKLYILILTLLFIAAVFVMAALQDDMGDIIQYLLIPSMIGLVISTIAIIKIGISEVANKSSVDLLSKQVENQIEYYEKINKIYGEFRSFRHDYKNHVLCLRSLIAADKKAEALEYMETIQDMSSVDKNRFHTGNVIIDALLNDKSEKAEKSNTKLDFSGAVPTEGISNADLCIIMANAIDNAIEACAKDTSGEPKLIKIDADFKQGFFFFRAVNPVFEEVQFKGKNKVVTSKSDKDKHGFGVANIVRTAEKYGGTAEISADSGEFSIEVQLTLEQA